MGLKRKIIVVLLSFVYTHMKLILTLLIAAILTSCSLTVAPDGTRSYKLDGEQAVRAAVIVSDAKGN